MSTWSEAVLVGGTRASVIKGGEAAMARSARMDAELRTTAFAPVTGVDARLTDPHLADVVDRARRTAVAAGRAEGRAEGYAAGLAAAAAEAQRTAAQVRAEGEAAERQRDAHLARSVELLLTAADAFRSTEQVVLAEIEDTVVELALSIARTVLDRELATSNDPGADAIARALALTPDDCPVTVRLHPDDVLALGELSHLAQGRQLVVVADPAVERGGCVAEAAGRQVDTQVGPALARVAAVLR
jgi:flagellar assembly protein FliH